MSVYEDFHTAEDLNGLDNVEMSNIEDSLFDKDPEDRPHTRRKRNDKGLDKNDYDGYVSRTTRAYTANTPKKVLEPPENGWVVIDLDAQLRDDMKRSGYQWDKDTLTWVHNDNE